MPHVEGSSRGVKEGAKVIQGTMKSWWAKVWRNQIFCTWPLGAKDSWSRMDG